MPPAILSRSRWSFSPVFSWRLCRCCLLAAVCPACCFCTDFFTGIFHEKSAGKFRPCLGCRFPALPFPLTHRAGRRRSGLHPVRRGAAPAGRGPPAGSGVCSRLPGPGKNPPSIPAKISSDFSGEVFYARGLSLVSWYINAPYSPPRLEKIHWKFWRPPRRENCRFCHFRQKQAGNFGQK